MDKFYFWYFWIDVACTIGLLIYKKSTIKIIAYNAALKLRAKKEDADAPAYDESDEG